MIKYYKLLDMLNRRTMTKEDLRQQIGISSATMSKISVHKPVSLDVIDKICYALNCQPGEIIEHVPETQEITPAATSTESQSLVENVTEPPESISMSPQKKKPHYKPFTEADAAKIDLQRLLSNVSYQLDIGSVFGMEVLAALMEKARKQKENQQPTNNHHERKCIP